MAIGLAVSGDHRIRTDALADGIPGAAHLTIIRRDPRWEDFEYTYERPENRFAYFGNGQTAKEQDPNSDMTPYLRLEEANDLRDLHERWWDL